DDLDDLSHSCRGPKNGGPRRSAPQRTAEGSAQCFLAAGSRGMVSFTRMRMRALLTRKELHGTFTSPVAYTVATVFLLVLGYTFSLTLFATKVENLHKLFTPLYVLSILLVPVLSMRAFAEERRGEPLEL